MLPFVRRDIPVLLSLVGTLSAPGLAQSRLSFPALYPADHPRPQVMVLGTMHLANNNRDMNNPQMDDVLQPRRQAELEEVAARLGRWAPTKIAVEVSVERQGWLDSLYQAYLAGGVTDDRNEIVQVAFRLAKRLGHTRVYATDWKHDMRIGEVMGWAAAHGQGEKAQRMGAWGRTLIAQINPAIQQLSLRQMFIEANSPENLVLSHQPYLLEARVGADTAYPGWDDVAGWYARNLRIFVNVSRVITAPDDRVLVLFGAGHAPLLTHYFEAAGDFQVVSPVDILQ